MASGGASRETFNVLSLLVDVRPLSGGAAAGAEDAVVRAGATSPLRHALEKRSGSGWLSRTFGLLADEGLSDGDAGPALAAVVNLPALSVRGARRDGGTTFLQAVVAQAQDGAQYLVVLTAVVGSGKPPEVADVVVEVLPVDCNSARDRADLAVRLEQWWVEHGLRQATPGPAGAPDDLLWLGDPARSGYLDVPGGWESQVKALAAAQGMRARVVTGSVEARQLSLPRGSVVVAVGGADWAQEHAVRLGVLDGRLIRAGSPGARFNDLLDEARGRVLETALEAIKPASAAPRELRPGESVYHRKVGSGGGNYDVFDEGSTTPCTHGEASFVRWGNKADKAFKGMARRYTNMQRDMLFHCSRYPNCGVYCARRTG